MSYAGELIADYKAVRARLWSEPATIRRKSPVPRDYMPSWSREAKQLRLCAAIEAWTAQQVMTEARIEEIKQSYPQPPEPETPTIHGIITLVCERYATQRIHIRSQRRDAPTVRPRHIAMYLCREMTPHSLPTIGRAFGGRDHTTVLNAFRRMTAKIAADPNFAAEVEAIKKDILASVGKEAE